MKILDNIKTKFAVKKINKYLKIQKRQVVQTSFAQAKSIGILYANTQNQNLDYVIKLYNELLKSGKRVSVLAFFPNKIENISTQINTISLKDFSLFCNPKSEIINNFIEDKFDLFINLDLGNNIILQYLSLLSNAKFKTGSYNDLNIKILDLMLNLNTKLSIENLIEQLKIYTNQLIKS